MMSLVTMACLLLAVACGMSYRRSRRDGRKLRFRMQVEQLATEVKHLLASIRPECVDDAMGAALQEIGNRLDLRRVTLVRDDPERVDCWCARAGQAIQPLSLGKSLKALAAAVEARGDGSHALILECTATQASSLSETFPFVEEGSTDWIGMRLRTGPSGSGLLSLEAGSGATLPSHDRNALRLVADVLEVALERGHLVSDRLATESRLSQAHRLETAGMLASGLAHNLNNIMGAVIGHAEMAEDAVGRGGLPLPHILEIKRAAERAEQLVESMLHLGKRKSLHQDIDLAKLTTETVSLLRASISPTLSIGVTDQSAKGRVIGRPAELQQVVFNLVRNAAQARATSISIRLLATALHTPKALRSTVLQPGDYIILQVSDDGCGMDEPTLGQMFQPFFTTRSIGTGLGLATISDIVVEHGGAIDVRSVFGAGCTFEIYLPSRSAMVPQQIVRRGQGQLVMIAAVVDSERLLHLEDVVAALGYEPCGFEMPVAAPTAVQRGIDHDVAIIDARGSAQPDAMKLVGALRERRMELPLIILVDERESTAFQKLLADDRVSIETDAEASRLGAALSRIMSRSTA